MPVFIDEHPWPEPGRFVHLGEASKRRRAAVRDTPPAAWRPWVCDGTVALDVGAAWGDTATSMALAAGPRGAVFALELVPALHHHNVVNALANRNLSRLIPVNVAVRGPGAGKLRCAPCASGAGSKRCPTCKSTCPSSKLMLMRCISVDRRAVVGRPRGGGRTAGDQGRVVRWRSETGLH